MRIKTTSCHKQWWPEALQQCFKVCQPRFPDPKEKYLSKLKIK